MIRALAAIVVLSFSAPVSSAQQSAGSVPIGAGRPETPGITRTQLRDDPKASVVRVHVSPGAKEPPHTHPYDVILVPVINGAVAFTVGGQTVTAFRVGEVQFIPRDTTHDLANVGATPLEFITIAVK